MFVPFINATTRVNLLELQFLCEPESNFKSESNSQTMGTFVARYTNQYYISIWYMIYEKMKLDGTLVGTVDLLGAIRLASSAQKWS